MLKKVIKQIIPKPVIEFYHKVWYPPTPLLLPIKLQLIDMAILKGSRRFADLGGMWSVNGGYSIHAADAGAESVTLVDRFATPEFESDLATRNNLHYLQRGNFSLQSVVDELSDCDTFMFYDVLLHQVNPDWNKVIEYYSAHATRFLIYNQQYTGKKTVRLIEQGKEWFLRHVPHSPEDTPEYAEFFEKFDLPHPEYTDGRLYRDVPDIWQWGITDDDLKQTFGKVGFKAVFEKDCGIHAGTEEIRNKAFVFERA